MADGRDDGDRRPSPGAAGRTRVAHIGARGTAFANVVLLDHVLDLEEIRVTSARPESRAAFGARLEAALGRPVRVVATVEDAVRGADVVVEATRLRSPSRSCGRSGSPRPRSSSPTAR